MGKEAMGQLDHKGPFQPGMRMASEKEHWDALSKILGLQQRGVLGVLSQNFSGFLWKLVGISFGPSSAFDSDFPEYARL